MYHCKVSLEQTSKNVIWLYIITAISIWNTNTEPTRASLVGNITANLGVKVVKISKLIYWIISYNQTNQVKEASKFIISNSVLINWILTRQSSRELSPLLQHICDWDGQLTSDSPSSKQAGAAEVLEPTPKLFKSQHWQWSIENISHFYQIWSMTFQMQ